MKCNFPMNFQGKQKPPPSFQVDPLDLNCNHSQFPNR